MIAAFSRAFGGDERRTHGRKTKVVSRRKVVCEGVRGTVLSLACGHFKFVRTDRGGDALCFRCPPLERRKKR